MKHLVNLHFQFTIHSDLGRVVQAIIREFERTPPPLAEQPGSSITSPTIPAQNTEALGRASPQYTLSFMGQQNFSPPVPSTTQPQTQSVAFPELNNLSLEELQFLNESLDRQEEFIEDLPQVKEMNKALDDLILQVEELAESNLSRTEQIEELKSGIDSRIEEVTKLAFENERLSSVYQNLRDKYSPMNIKVRILLLVEMFPFE